MFSISELRTLVDAAIDILHGLDQGNETLIKCQDTLRKFLVAIEIDGTGLNPPLPTPYSIANNKILQIISHNSHLSH